MNALRVKKRSFIKKQLLLVGVFCFAMLVLFTIGFSLSKTFNSTDYLTFLPTKNHVFLVAWRSLLYVTVIALLSPRIFVRVFSFAHRTREPNMQVLLRCRNVAGWGIVIYELVIVQNVLSHVAQWGLAYVR